MIEQSFIDSGFSFTASKLIPYLITILMGLILVYLVRKRVRFKLRIVNVFLKLVIIAIPFILYFAFYPIYQGDFTNGAERVKRTESNAEISGQKLVVIAIPGCQYCEGAMNTVKLLKKRNPSLEIEYIVCSSDSSTTKTYSELGNGEINVRLAKNSRAMSALAKGRYPTFVLSEENLPLTRWSNDGFGVRALDQVESLVK